MTPPQAIELRHITTRTSVVVEQAKVLLQDVCVSVPAGEVTVIEYTERLNFECLAEIVARLRVPETGQVEWFGERFDAHDKRYLAGGKNGEIFVINDQPVLLSEHSVRSQFSSVRKILGVATTEQAIKDDLALCTWIGIDSKLDQLVSVLTPDQQWLLSLCLRLVAHPKLLIIQALPVWVAATWVQKLMDLLKLWARNAHIAVLLGSEAGRQSWSDPIYLLHGNQIVNAVNNHELTLGARTYPADQGLFVVDSTGKLSYLNRQAEAIFGWTLEEIEAQGMDILCQWGDTTGHGFRLAEWVAGGAGEAIELRAQTKEMGERLLHLSFEPTAGEKDTAQIVVRVEDRTAKQELDRLKADFAAITGHELRTPLTTIRGALDMLRLALGSTADPVVPKMLDALSQSTQRLQNLSNNLISLSYDGEGIVREVFKSEDWLTLVRSTMEPYVKLAESKKNTFRLVVPAQTIPAVKCDANRLVEAMANYLENAVEHATTGSEILLTVTFDAVHSRATLAITNEGQPLSTSAQESLFTLFFRAREAKDFTNMHLGLGLYVTKRIVERQGGDVWVAVDTTRGTNTFGLWVPVGR